MATLSRRILSSQVTRVPQFFYRQAGSSTSAPEDEKQSKQQPVSKEAKDSTPEPITNQADNTKYQAEQLYQYNPMSFYDIEGDMDTYRLKQPSNTVKYESQF